MKQKVAIAGGGLTGLTIALNLSKKGKKVAVFEKENEVGGLASSVKFSGGEIDKTYRHIFKSDKEIIDLIEKLGLGKELEWKDSSLAQYFEGKLFAFGKAVDLLKFKPLKIADKLRLGLIYIYLQKSNNWQSLKGIGAADWMEKWAGKRNYEVVWKPLLKGKFHQYYKQVSMAWLWARIKLRGNSKEKGGEKLGYLKGSFGRLIEKLADSIVKNGGLIKINQNVEQIRNKGDKVEITIGDKKLIFDKLIACMPTKSFYDLTKKDKSLLKVAYLGFVNVIFSSKQSLSKYYWHNISDEKSPFLAFIQQTNLIDKKNYNNKHVYYMGAYLPQNHKYLEKKNERLVYKDFFDYLAKIFPNFDKSLVEEKRIFRFKWAQHIADLNYDQKIPEYKTGLKNVYLVNFSQIFPYDRGMNYAVAEGKKVAKLVEKSF